MRTLVVLCIFFFGFAHAFSPHEDFEKIYVPSERIAIHNNRIFVEFDDKWMEAPHLFSDKKGIYVLDREVTLFRFWKCGDCGKWNWGWTYVCECGNEFQADNFEHEKN